MATADQIAEQLKAQKAFFKYDYGNATLDPWLTSELARLIASTGVENIQDIASYESIAPYAYGATVDYLPIQFYYDARTGNPIDKIGGRDFNPTVGQDVFATTQNADYTFTYHIKFAGSVPYFVVSAEKKMASGGSYLKSLSEAIAPILPVVMVGLNFFAPGFATAIGNAVLGPLGVASTTLATALGNVAISTVASGGDVEGAVKSAMLGTLGAQIGSVVGAGASSALNSDVIGKATAAATSAAISGGDVKYAVAGSLLPAGVSAVGDLFDSFGSVDMFPGDPLQPTDSGTDFWASPPVTLSNPGGTPGTVGGDSYIFSTGDYLYPMDTPLGTVGDATIPSDPTTTAPSAGFPVELQPVDVPVYTDTPEVVIADTPTGQNFNLQSVIGQLAPIALAALKISQAYQSAGQPQIRVSGQTARGDTVTANPNGTVSVNGRPQLPPKGVPYITPTGGMIMNNGDGTYTSVSTAGVSATNRYTSDVLQSSGAVLGNLSATLGVSQNALLYGALGLGALLLFSRRN